MASTRMSFSPCTYSERLNESRNILYYDMYVGKFEGCSQCKESDDLNLQRMEKRVDLESNLWIFPRKATMCDAAKYKPCFLNNSCNHKPSITHRLCDRDLINLYNVPKYYDNSFHLDTSCSGPTKNMLPSNIADTSKIPPVMYNLNKLKKNK